MKGLVYKDFCVLKTTGRMFILFILVFGAAGIMGGDPSFATSMCMMMMLVMPINCFSYDQMAGWDVFAAAAPGGRRVIVGARYAVVLAMGAAGFVVSAVLGGATIITNRGIVPSDVLLPAAGVTAIGLALMAILLPCLYKFGVEKARMLMMLIVAVPFILIAILSRVDMNLSLGSITEQSLTIVFLAALPAALLMFGLSYCISRRIFEHKEL